MKMPLKETKKSKMKVKPGTINLPEIELSETTRNNNKKEENNNSNNNNNETNQSSKNVTKTTKSPTPKLTGSSPSGVTSNELIANFTCFNSSKSLLKKAFLLFHISPSIVILLKEFCLQHQMLIKTHLIKTLKMQIQFLAFWLHLSLF